MNAQMKHNTEAGRYEIYSADTLAGYADYSDNTETRVRDFHHTVTFPEFRGRGLAAQVVGYALGDTRSAGFSVRPTCWYVGEYIAAHPEYRDLLR